MTLTEPSPTAPALGVVVLCDAEDAADSSRLEAELHGRIAVGTQVLVVDVGDLQHMDSEALGIMAGAAMRLQGERSGSVVLRNASAELLRQLRVLRLDHMFELEI